MKTSNKIVKAIGWLVAVASAASLALAAKVDLSRETPVPANEQVPIIDFLRPPILWDAQLNLAGTHIGAILNTAEDHTELMVYDIQSQKIDRIGGHGQDDIYAFNWLDSKRLIYHMRAKAAGGGQGMIAAEVGALDKAYPLIQFVGSGLIAVPPGDRLHPVVHFAANSMNTGKYGEVAVIGTDRARAQIVELVGDLPSDVREVVYENNIRHIVRRYPVLQTNEGGDYRYIADREGKLAFGFKNQDGVLSLHQLVGDTWQQCPEDPEEIEVIGAGDNPGELVVLGERKEGKPRPLELIEAATGKVIGEPLWQDPAYDFDGYLYRDPKSNRILGAIGNKSGPFSAWFDDGMRGLQKMLEKTVPGQVVRILGTDEAGKTVLFYSFSDRQPGIYSMADLEKHTAGPFKNPTPWIDPQRMQPMRVMPYKTRDGKKFDAFATLPKGASKQNPVPLLVIIPENRAAWGFSAEAQLFASRGYAVLQPNYRGMSGYNWQYPKEDEWAFRKMHEDVTDAVKALLSTGLVDRNRVAISGFRFGGYLALCGVAFEPSLYRCSVAISPVCDFGKVIEDQKFHKNESPYYARMCLKLGDPKTQPEKFDAMSPLKHAGEIRVPVLISEGEYDLSVEISMAGDLVSAVRRNGIQAESIKFLNESGGVRFLDHRVELFERIEAFLAKNVGAGAP